MFKRNRTTTELPDLLPEMDEVEALDKSSVLDYLVQLDEAEFEKMVKVAKVYRDADKKAADIWGPETEADPNAVEVRIEKPANDEELDQLVDDELTAAFIEDAPKAKGTK